MNEELAEKIGKWLFAHDGRASDWYWDKSVEKQKYLDLAQDLISLVKEAGWKSPELVNEFKNAFNEQLIAEKLVAAEAVKQTKAEVEKIVDSNYTDRVKLWEALKAYCGALPHPDGKEEG